MRVLHVCYSDGLGGADIAAYRIHRALLEAGTDSRMLVRRRTTDDPTVTQMPAAGGVLREYARDHLAAWSLWTQKSSNSVHRSINAVDSGVLSLLDDPSIDVVNLHWVGSDTLSLREIGAITRPVVWTMHDSWPFCGAEHHPEDADDRRFTVGYTREARRPGNSRFDLDAWVWRRKRRRFTRPFHLVGPSRWMVEQARASTLMGTWPMTVIPNPLDPVAFTRVDSALARSTLGLPIDRPVVLFGAMGGGQHRNKGWDLLQPALSQAAREVPGVVAAVFGEDAPAQPARLGLPVHYLGRVVGDDTMARIYSAADVMVVPSRIESFSQTASEAQACGTPVVAFATSGLLDVLADGETGLLADPFDPAALARDLAALLLDPMRSQAMGERAARRARELWAGPLVAKQYLDWYREAVRTQRVA